MSSKKFDLGRRQAPAVAPAVTTAASKAADAAFRKKDQAAAMSDYEKGKKAERKKTDQLRALRFEKEAAEREEEAREAEAKAKAAKKPAAKKKTKAALIRYFAAAPQMPNLIGTTGHPPGMIVGTDVGPGVAPVFAPIFGTEAVTVIWGQGPS
jgi:hypothetical protein